MRLGQFWVEPGCLQVMRLRFLQVVLDQKRTRKIKMSIDKMRVDSQCLSILRHCLVELAMFFQEGAITIPGLGGLWSYPDGGFAFRRRFFKMIQSLQNISIAGVELGVVRVDSQRFFKMSLRLFQVSFANQDGGQIGVGLCQIGINM